MILPVYLIGHPVLRKQAVEISMDHPGLSELIENMYETMYHDKGVGLAAPQIGESLRLFVIDTEAFLETDPETEQIKTAFINPIVEKEFGDDFVFNEGCLSIPDVHVDVMRKAEVIVTYTDENGKRKTRNFKGLAARVIQHEYDHLEGKIFTDKIPQIKKMVLKRKLNDIASGKHKPFYKSVIK
ncbi:MAG: peptide deformylase [Bacteroidales bacterium]|jgi:peptide deformylase|nr:peptide deformylase [Bacteroidales bacterium]